jgi:nitrite reductase/ring-hydroxylating ferredoxin subunit
MTSRDSGKVTDPRCEACVIGTSRRDFLRDAALAVGAFAGLGAHAEGEFPFPISLIAAPPRADQIVKYPVPSTDGAQIDRENQVILVRWEHVIYAFNLSCPHQNTALRWNDEDHRFQCPKHHSQYQPDGEFITGRATRGMDRLGIKLDGATLLVDLDQFYQQDKDAAEWSAAFVKIDA